MILYLLLVVICSSNMNLVSGIPKARCVDQDRIALLRFKKALVDDHGVLNSWNDTANAHDCCRWSGVGCNDSTGQVITLDLSLSYLNGEIDSSLLSLSSLTYLDLSGNNFTRIPKFIGSLKNLQHLKFSDVKLTSSTEFPDHIGNLSNLQTLDLAVTKVVIKNTHWLSSLSSLKYLNLTDIDLSKSVGLLYTAIKLPSLVELQLHYCELPNDTANSFLGPLTNLSNSFSVLDISLNHLPSSIIYPWLFNFSGSLMNIDLYGNELLGTIPDAFGTFTNLETLDLTVTDLKGGIPSSFRNLSRLRQVYLIGNNLDQDLPGLFNNLPVRSLEVLDLTENRLSGLLPDFTAFSALTALFLALNQLNGSFPRKFQEKSNLLILDLADNRINGLLPDLSVFGSLLGLHLDRNLLQGSLAERLGSLTKLEVLGASSNLFQGPLSSLCNLTQLRHLDLSNNKLSGKLPNCWNNYDRLNILNLENNKFTGAISDSIGALQSVGIMSMRGNKLTGEIPFSLRNCTELELLDLGENKLSGTIPNWIGEMFSKLRVLSLPSNRFRGAIPTSLCKLKKIQILDISSNKISGNIPKCVNDFSGMTKGSLYASMNYFLKKGFYLGRQYYLDSYAFKAVLEWKGRRSEYENTLGLVVSLDLSSNRLTGEIPDQITSLVALIAVNLSRNNLTGPIPQDVGLLRWLDFLDLSRNNLVGGIPLSLSRVSNLGVLDLSFNNLSGRIPKSTQLQSFNMLSYIGNPALCGDPLLNGCPGDGDGPRGGRQEDVAKEAEDDGKLISNGFYVSILVGFVFGFWGICGSLLVSDSWRYGYFKFLKMMKDKTLVTVEISYFRLRRRIPI